MKPACLLAAVSLSTSTLADVIDLGNLDQYRPKSGDIPSELDPNGLWVSRSEGGTSFIPGKQISSNIDKAISNCQVFDGGCYNDINKASTGLWVQTDPRLESRQLGPVAAAASVVVLFMAIVGPYLFDSGKGLEKVESGVFVPDQQASSFSVLTAGATVTLSGGGSAIATLTQAAPPTSVQVSATPTVSRVSEAKDGLEKGDVEIQLPPDLADKLNEYVQRIKDNRCKDGEAFQESAKRGTGAISPQVVCATENVIQQAGPDGIFSGLMVMDLSKVHIDLSDSISKSKEAVVALSDFIKAYSPLLAAPLPQVADQVAIWTLLLIYDALVNNNPIGANHRVKAELIEFEDEGSQTEETTTSSGGCPQPSELPCGMENEKCGREDKTDGKGGKAVCKDGDHKDCECSFIGYTFYNQVSEEFGKTLMDFIGNLGESGSTESAAPDTSGLKCDIDPSAFQSKLFHSDENSVAKEYCQNWSKDSDFRVTVNAKGEIQGPRLRGRTPPPNVNAMDSWRVDLEYNKSENGGECSLGCDDSFGTIVNKCTSNSGGSYIYKKGTYDLGCGTLTWSVYDSNKPAEPEKPAQQEPSCGEKPTKLPAKTFSSSDNKLYDEFCKNWKKEEASVMLVDARGTKVEPGKNTDDTGTFKQWRANFDYAASSDGGECTMTCEEAFDKISNTCQKDSMQYRQASIQAGCGTFRYHVYIADFDWKGAGACSSVHNDHCKDSIYNGVKEHTLYAAGGGDEENGHCRANQAGYGCGTFLQSFDGNKCEAFGFEMKNYFEALRGNGASKCGSVHLGDGCLFTVNRVTGCKNRYKSDA